MRSKIFLMILSASVSSCAIMTSSAPDAEQCALYAPRDSDDLGLVCRTIQSKKTRFIPIIDGNGFLCFQADEFEKLRTWYKGVK